MPKDAERGTETQDRAATDVATVTLGGSLKDNELSNTFTSYDSTQSIALSCAGNQDIEIEKLFGPLVACDVKVRLDVAAGQWIVWRKREPRDGPSTWEEMARFDCQESIEFSPSTPS